MSKSKKKKVLRISPRRDADELLEVVLKLAMVLVDYKTVCEENKELRKRQGKKS